MRGAPGLSLLGLPIFASGAFLVAFLVVLMAVSPSRAEDCPAKSLGMGDIIDAINAAPGCNRAMKIFQACEFGTSGDIRFGAAVEKKCERGFLARLNEPKKLLYRRAMQACDDKYKDQDGTMYRSFTAFCRAEVSQRYARRARKAKGPLQAR